MIYKVKKYIEKNNMINQGDRIVLGVSGGADSVCLLEILSELKQEYNMELYVVHVHHGIRGSEADADERYVSSLCESMGVWYRRYEYDIPGMAQKRGMSEEEMGRDMRYKTFNMVLDEVGASKIAVAHNADDCVETILHNMCRGTGIKGMCGIPPVRGNIIRPVMCLGRNEIEKYLNDRKIEYRTDSTNLKTDYTRNKIRLELIPYMKRNINPVSGEHILRLSEQLSQIEEYMEQQTEDAFERAAHKTDGGISIDINEFMKCHVTLQSGIVRLAIKSVAGKLKDITSENVEDVMMLMSRGTGKSVNLPYNIICTNVYDRCEIRKDNGNNINGIKEKEKVIVNVPGEYILKSGDKFILSLENSLNFKEKMYTKWFDYDKIKNALQIRFRENGDFLEVAKGGHKKLKSYFIDEKVPREQRDSIPLLADGQHILWVTGYRISEAYKITEDTRNVLKVQYCERNGKDDGR